MNILALDTCTESCSAALLYQGDLYEVGELTQRGHSDLILSMMDSLFEQAGATIAEVNVLAFGRGPGSFTGVRVGVGVAQGIAFARDIPIVAVSSLAALAQNAADKLDVDRVAVAMDARMGEIYCASYLRQQGVVSLLDQERVCIAEQFGPADNNLWTGAGTAWAEYDSVLRQGFEGHLAQVYSDYYPQASSIIKLAEVEIKAGRIMSADQALPVYLRDNVAKKKGEQ